MLWTGVVIGVALAKPIVLSAGAAPKDVREAVKATGRTVEAADVQTFNAYINSLAVRFDGGEARGCYGASMPTAAVRAAIEVLQSHAARTNPDAFLNLVQRTEADLVCVDEVMDVAPFFYAKARHATAMGRADMAVQAYRDAKSTGFQIKGAPADVAEQFAAVVLPEGSAWVQIEPYPERVWVDGVLTTHGPQGIELPLGRHVLTVHGTRTTGIDLMVERSGTVMLPGIYDANVIGELLVPYRAQALRELAAMERSTLLISDGVSVYKVTPRGVVDLGAPGNDPDPPRRRPGDDMVCLGGGTFLMGEPGTNRRGGPRHLAYVDPFCIQDHPVTQAEYLGLTGQAPSSHRDCPDCPVERVSWIKATEYANRLSSSQALKPAYSADGSVIAGATGWRLPTEAQWEYAARGDEPHRWSGSNDSKAVAWTQLDAEHPMPVCTKARNGFGLCDLSGNVGEWVGDWSAPYSLSGTQVNPTGPASGDLRVVRGGGFEQSADLATVNHRGAMTPSASDGAIGFRLVRPK